ncbi:MAG TPA: DUF4136 domain-containing protein [Terriglobales bacterium]|jgi:hypothetical protein
MRSFGSSRAQFLLCLLVLFTGAAQAQKIKVEYDKRLDFSKFKTFALDSNQATAKPMLRLAILAAVQDDLIKRGLKQVNDNPDLYIQVYGAIDSDVIANYNDPIYGSSIPPINANINMWYGIPGTMTTVVVHKGQMVVDVIDAGPKKLIWRGVAQQKLSSDNREKLLDQVNTTVERLFKQYPVAKQ